MSSNSPDEQGQKAIDLVKVRTERRLDSLAARLKADPDLADRTMEYVEANVDTEGITMTRPRGRPRIPTMTMEQVADYLQLSLRHVYRLIQEEGLPASKVGGRVYRVKPQDLDAWLESRKPKG